MRSPVGWAQRRHGETRDAVGRTLIGPDAGQRDLGGGHEGARDRRQHLADIATHRHLGGDLPAPRARSVWNPVALTSWPRRRLLIRTLGRRGRFSTVGPPTRRSLRSGSRLRESQRDEEDVRADRGHVLWCDPRRLSSNASERSQGPVTFEASTGGLSRCSVSDRAPAVSQSGTAGQPSASTR